MNRPFALACSCLAVILPVFAEPGTATLTMVDEESFNEIILSFDPPLLPAGMGTTTLTGTVEVLLEIDPETDQVTEMTVTGGTVMGSPVSISESTPFVGSYSLTSSILGAELDTPNPPGLVDPATGEFDASQHTFTVNSGTLDGTLSVPVAGINEMVNFDFADMPVGGAGSLTENGTVSLAETGSSPTSKSYDVTVLLPISVEETFEVEGPTGPIAIPIGAAGEVKAVGPVTIDVTPTNPYFAWTESNGIPGAAFDGDENGDGVANGLQWGLGLAASDSPFPHLLQPVGDTGATVDFTVTFPAGGSASDIFVLVADDPEGVPFAPLASDSVSSGNPIPAGTGGTVTINLPKNTIGFVRLSVEAPTP